MNGVTAATRQASCGYGSPKVASSITALRIAVEVAVAQDFSWRGTDLMTG